MAQPNVPRPAEVRPADPVETPKAALKQVELGLADSVEAVRVTLGSAPKPVPDDIDTKENAARRAEILAGGFDDVGEVYEFGMLRLEQQRSQMQKELKEGKAVDVGELVTVSQAEAYHEYLPMLLHALQESMNDYRALRQAVPDAVLRKPDVARGEVAAQMTLAILDEALKERVAFANAMLLAQSLRPANRTKFDGTPLTDADAADYRKRLDGMIASGALRKDSVAALQGNEQLGLEHANKLNQRILDVLSGKALAVQENEVGFYPQAMELELLTAAYEFTLEQEKKVVLDPRNVAAEARIAELEAQAKDAGGTLPKALKEEYEGLAVQQLDRKARLGDLAKERARYLQELLRKTDALGRFQIRAEELTAIQRQFGRAIDPLAGPSNKQPIPENERKGIDANMETRKQFHLDRIDAFLGSLEKEDGVLSIGAGERFEDFNNKNLRPIALKVVETLAGLASLPAPESFGLKKRIRNAIAGDLEDAMGIPKNADGTPKPEEQWTPEERATVEKKAKSVLDAINEFRYETRKNDKGETEFVRDERGNAIEKDHTKKLRSTIGALRAMPPAKIFVNMPVIGLPDERITIEQVNAINEKLKDPRITVEEKKALNGPGVYAKLMDQLLEDWGTADGEPPSGVIGETGEMMRKIDGIVGVHVDVAEAEIQLAADIADWLVYIAAALGIYALLDVAYKVKKLFSQRRPTKREVEALRKELRAATDENAQLRAENTALKAKESGPDERLLDLEGAGDEHLDTTTIRPPANPEDIAKTAADVDTAAQTDQKGDAKGGKKPRGGRRG